MNKITRATLRGEKLKSFCKRAKISKHECGLNDNRHYCYGLVSKQTDELIEECANCKANVIFVEFIKGGKR